MTELLLLLLLAFASMLWIAYHYSKKDDQPPELPQGDRDTSIADSAEKPASSGRFDPATTEPMAERRSITGPARVVDGDTVVIKKTQIRLFGIDAPELDHPYGQKAKWALVSLCKGQLVRAEIGEEDAYGRTVASCFLEDGRDLSSEMVQQGLAIDWPKYSGGKYKHLEVPDARRKMWLADARQRGRMHVWEKFELQKNARR